jgi:acyl carrier protein phosphodiesterase
MNFLAHLYLSGNRPEVLVGNFIADSVTSQMRPDFSSGIQKGVLLHQAIDAYTDRHPLVEQSKARLRPRYHKYSGVIVDIFYDHFLASQWSDYSSVSLRDYADNIYLILNRNLHLFPERPKKFYSYMQKKDALFLYSGIPGIQMVMQGMSQRSRFASGMETCTEELVAHYAAFNTEFREFFPQLMQMSESFLEDYRETPVLPDNL